MIVELEPGVWLTEGDGDPPRTLRIENATRYPNMTAACKALTKARKYRPFKNATIMSAATDVLKEQHNERH